MGSIGCGQITRHVRAVPGRAAGFQASGGRVLSARASRPRVRGRCRGAVAGQTRAARPSIRRAVRSGSGRTPAKEGTIEVAKARHASREPRQRSTGNHGPGTSTADGPVFLGESAPRTNAHRRITRHAMVGPYADGRTRRGTTQRGSRWTPINHPDRRRLVGEPGLKIGSDREPRRTLRTSPIQGIVRATERPTGEVDAGERNADRTRIATSIRRGESGTIHDRRVPRIDPLSLAPVPLSRRSDANLNLKNLGVKARSMAPDRSWAGGCTRRSSLVG